MSTELSIAIIIVLLILLIVQLSFLVIIKKFISKLTSFTKFKSIQSPQKDLLNKSVKTCKNCQFRQSFLNVEIEEKFVFTYLCKFNGKEISLRDSCSRFMIEKTRMK
ncbi:MAG: hypothetical protein D8M58_02135 [Calditrichaeota bacterium]|nr:MAG: hypothetical protein DWQ03_04945 [Calditrichota bacterium]MBL1204165.1 hypothetical protein [Calditrichota bacterium]